MEQLKQGMLRNQHPSQYPLDMNTSQNTIDEMVNDFCNPAKNPLMKELEDYLKECEKTITLHQAFQREFGYEMNSVTQEKILKAFKKDQV